MLARWIRTWDSRLLQPLLRLIAGSGATPHMLTVASLAILVVAGILFSFGYMAFGACFLVLGALLDALDGELARFLGIDSPFGGLLDSLSAIITATWLSIRGCYVSF